MRVSRKRLIATATVVALSVGTLSFRPDDRYFQIAKNLDIFSTLFSEVNRYYVDEVEPGDLMTTGIESMLASLDPYTNYIPEERIEDYRTMTSGEYSGVGVRVGERNGKMTVTMCNEGFSAYRAGIRIGDELLEIDGRSIAGRDAEEVDRLLKGQVGKPVKVKLLRPGSEPTEYALIREKIKLRNVPYVGMVTEEVGIIQLTDFTKNASKEVSDALLDLKEQGATKIILDLRGNPGGLLDEAIRVSNVFLAKGVEIVSTKGKVSEWNRTHYTLNAPTDADIPLAVLIDGNSASAAEIVAGSIQDYDRGALVGQRSFGKGLVQVTRNLTYNSKLKVTVAKYYIASGRCIQALDYSNRDENGRVRSVPDSLRREFKTKAGRTVMDGAGVEPDVAVEERVYAPITKALVNKGLIFDYATLYCLKREDVGDPREFALSKDEYGAFVEWLSDKSFDYASQVQRALDEVERLAKKEKVIGKAEKHLADLRAAIAHDRQDDLERFSEEISELLEQEICKRYYSESGIVESTFDDDPEIAEALALLGDPERYAGILKGED